VDRERRLIGRVGREGALGAGEGLGDKGGAIGAVVFGLRDEEPGSGGCAGGRVGGKSGDAVGEAFERGLVGAVGFVGAALADGGEFRGGERSGEQEAGEGERALIHRRGAAERRAGRKDFRRTSAAR
jgi:hypothetical protein